MIRLLLVGAACLGAFALSASASTTTGNKLTFPQKRGATYDEVRANQALGRMVLPPDGAFFLYEWSRPYDWAPSIKGLAPPAAARKQTFIYKVDTTKPDTTSELLFQPAPGATYYLGNLSPDNKYVSFYEIDRDDNKIRAGAVLTNDGISPKITWFEQTPDVATLDRPAVWVSNEQLVYPVKTGTTRLVRASAVSGAVEACSAACVAEVTSAAGAISSKAAPASDPASGPVGAGPSTTARGESEQDGVPVGAKLLARSQSADLEVFAADTAEKLSLYFRRGGSVQTLFENDRRPKAAEIKK